MRIMLVVVFSIAALTFGCGKNEGTEVLEKDTSFVQTTDPVDSFMLGIEAYNGQDLAALMPMFSPEIEWRNATAMGTRLKGRMEIAKQLANERAVFPDSHLRVRRMLLSGDNLIVEALFEGTHRGPIYGFPPTGKRVSYGMVYFLKMQGGLVTQNVAYFNPAAPFRQIGVITASNINLPVVPHNKPVVVRDPGQPTDENTVKSFIAAFAAGDLEAGAALLAEGAIFTDNAHDKIATGVEDIKATLTASRAQHPITKIDVLAVMAAGPYVACQLMRQGEYEMKNVPDKGNVKKNVMEPAAAVFLLEGGKIKTIDWYNDDLALYQQFELPPQEAFHRLSEPPMGPTVNRADARPMPAAKDKAPAK